MRRLRNVPAAKNLWIRKEGGFQDFLSIFFVSKCQKMSQGNTSVLRFRKIPLARKFMDRRWVSSKIFRRKFFVSKCRIFLQGNNSVLCFSNFF